jgi:hypothetical protein
MLPTTFNKANLTFAKNQPQYIPLPAHIEKALGTRPVTTCWKVSFWERIRILLTGRVWVEVLTFGDPLQPLKLGVTEPVLLPNNGEHVSFKVGTLEWYEGHYLNGKFVVLGGNSYDKVISWRYPR